MNIIGIDPGLNITGVGILEIREKKLYPVFYDHIKTKASDPLPERLKVIIDGVNRSIELYNPQFAAIEDIFYSVNIKSAILLGHTRGAIIATIIAKNIKVMEFTALQIKKSVVGYGKADKNQVKKLVELHLGLKLGDLKYDVSDALACALCLGLNLTGGYVDL